MRRTNLPDTVAPVSSTRCRAFTSASSLLFEASRPGPSSPSNARTRRRRARAPARPPSRARASRAARRPPSAPDRASRRAPRGTRAAPCILRGSHTRSPRASRESSGASSQKSTRPSSVCIGGRYDGRHRVRAPERLALADEEAAGAVGQEEALVRVERDRVGPLDAAHGAAPPLGEREEAAVGGVDVEPEPLARGHIGERLERRRRRRCWSCPALATTRKGESPAARSSRTAAASASRAQAEARVAGGRAHALGEEAGEERGLLHRVVRLLGGVEHAGAGSRAGGARGGR